LKILNTFQIQNLRVLHKTATTSAHEKDPKKGLQKNYGKFSVHLYRSEFRDSCLLLVKTSI
jgi:hypothetical protein